MDIRRVQLAQRSIAAAPILPASTNTTSGFSVSAWNATSPASVIASTPCQRFHGRDRASRPLRIASVE